MIDDVDWEPFFEEEAAKIRKNQRAPGVALILGGREREDGLERTWGNAGIEPERALELDTPIRAGSISKVVTAIAVQQLVESGDLELEVRLGEVVGWELPHGYGEATIGNLLTHRAGVGERFARQSTPRAEEIANLSDYLRESLPPPVAAIGETVTYSNFGISLAGLAVEIVKGKRFADYARDEIFRPLGMERATFIPGPEMEPEMAEGYNWVLGAYRKLPLRHWKVYPASSLVATPRELGLLMREFLEEESSILANASALLEEQTKAVPDLPGMGLSFWLDRIQGQKVVWHTGHMPGHRTGFYLFPEAGFGIVLYYNIDPNVLRGFLENVVSFAFPDPPKASVAEIPARPQLNQFRGHYRHSWYPHHHLGKCTALLGQEVEEFEVKMRDRRLLVRGESYSHLGGDVFVDEKQGRRIGFLRDGRDRVSGLYRGGRDRYEKISAATRGRTQMGLAAIFAAVFSACPIFIGVGMLKGTPILSPEIGWGLFLTCLLNMGFGFGIGVMTARGASKLVQDVPFPLGPILALPILGCVIWLLSIVQIILSWNTGWSTSAWGCFVAVVGVASEGAFLWFLSYWNLLGWRY